MLVECGSEKAAEGESRDDAEREGEYRVRPRQEGMHVSVLLSAVFLCLFTAIRVRFDCPLPTRLHLIQLVYI